MSITRFRITPTPSITATNTPTKTPTSTPCPTVSPSMTQTVTPTITPTSSMNQLCPEELYYSGSSTFSAFTGTYQRTYSWTGGTFTGGWFDRNFNPPITNCFNPGVDSLNNLYSVWTRFDGTYYYTLVAAKVFPSSTVNSWIANRNTTGYMLNNPCGTPIGVSQLFSITDTEFIGGVGLPKRGDVGTSIPGYISYPAVCPTTTPSNTPSITPSITPTSPDYCPEQITLTQTTPNNLSGYSRTYNRLYSYSGGNFNSAYLETYGTPNWKFNTVDSQGYYGAVYGAFDGSTYYTIFPIVQASGPTGINIYLLSTGTTGYFVGNTTTFGLPILDTFPFGIKNGYKLPSKGSVSNNFYVSYPAVCPTTTPSNTPTLTPTVTSSPNLTPSVTPTLTPTNTTTSTITPTVSSTPTLTPTNTPPCQCGKYELSTSFTNPVFNYVDCNGDPQTIQIGFFATLELCAESVTEPSGGGVTYLGCCDLTPTPTRTPTVTPTLTPSISPSSTPTVTPTNSVTPTITQTNTPSITPSITPTKTVTPTVTPTSTETWEYWDATQYLDCVQNSAVGAYKVRVPYGSSGLWGDGDDGYQYLFANTQSSPFSYTVTLSNLRSGC